MILNLIPEVPQRKLKKSMFCLEYSTLRMNNKKGEFMGHKYNKV